MAIPDQARNRLEQRLAQHRHRCWNDLRDVKVRYRGDYAYITGIDADGPLPLCRLRYNGSPDHLDQPALNPTLRFTHQLPRGTTKQLLTSIPLPAVGTPLRLARSDDGCPPVPVGEARRFLP
jgi:hypothetical protein